MVKFTVAFYKVAGFLLACLYTVGLPISFHGNALSGQITVTAHSGCMDNEDNSIKAMEAGIAEGATIIEFDLNFTADGTPVLSHNTPDEDTELVTLAEAFEFLAEQKGILANVDVKSTEHIEKVPDIAASAGVSDRIFFTGVSEGDIKAVREKCPGIPYYLNTSVADDEDFEALAKKTASLGAIGLNISWKEASPELVKTFHKNGLPVSVWTVSKPEQIITSILYGVDNLTTRRPDTACKLVAK